MSHIMARTEDMPALMDCLSRTAGAPAFGLAFHVATGLGMVAGAGWFAYTGSVVALVVTLAFPWVNLLARRRDHLLTNTQLANTTVVG